LSLERTESLELASVPEFKRKQWPLLPRIAFGALIECVLPPVVWAMEKAGRAERMLAVVSDKREQEFIRKNPFRDYVPGKQDVFVMTYAKSGTNWMMQIVYQLIHHGEGEFDHIHSVVPWPDAKLMSPTMNHYAIPLEQATHWQAAAERKRVIKTHLNWELLPYSEEARYIGVIRDPKDVFVSTYFFIKDSGAGRAMPSLDTVHRVFLAGKALICGSWAVNAAGFWAQRNKPNVLILSFASMKLDLEGTVRRVAAFLDIQVADDVIRKVCEKSSFEYMKTIDCKFATFQTVPWRPASAMIRRGRQGGSSELLTAQQQKEIDERMVAELNRLGSDLPYEEFCGLVPASKAAAGEPRS
jgi:Sulfotransferase domain